MLNWRRPRYVEFNVAQYIDYSLISEVLVFSNAGSTLNFCSIAKQPTLIIANADLGLYTRYAAAVLARNECILHVDDDILVPEPTVERLYSHWCSDPEICHSLHGRNVQAGYSREDVFGSVEVVLTRCLMVSRTLCAHALAHVHTFDDMVCEPYGNGEDIILSFTAVQQSGRLNRAHRLPFTNHPGYGEDEVGHDCVSVHRRWPGHQRHRERLISRCRDHFGVAKGDSTTTLAQPILGSFLQAGAAEVRR